jgi:UDP-glucose-4-epimerase GalE
MHFGAYASVAESVKDPGRYYENNVSRTLVLLDEMVRRGIKRLVFSSSASTYGEPVEIPIPEDHPKNPTNPYGRSKLIIEDVLRDYDAAYGLKSVSLRYFNAAGADPEGELGEDHKPEEHLIPIVLQAALGKRPGVSIYGTDWDTPDGTCIRDYIHVMDLAQAHILACEALESGGETTSYNLGNGSGYSVQQVIEVAREVTGRPIGAIPGSRRPGDPARLVASSDKIRRELGWEPEIRELRDIVKTAWKWHSAHPEGYGD